MNTITARKRAMSAATVCAAIFALAASPHASAQATIRIGEINSYKAQPAFLDPYRKGMQLAIEDRKSVV